jgi:hypothetical protein
MAEALRAFTKPDFVKLEKMEMDIVSNLTAAVSVAAKSEEPPAIDHKALNRARQIKAEKARELAAEMPSITVKALMGATGCGAGAARKAIDQAKQAALAPEVAV